MKTSTSSSETHHLFASSSACLRQIAIPLNPFNLEIRRVPLGVDYLTRMKNKRERGKKPATTLLHRETITRRKKNRTKREVFALSPPSQGVVQHPAGRREFISPRMRRMRRKVADSSREKWGFSSCEKVALWEEVAGWLRLHANRLISFLFLFRRFFFCRFVSCGTVSHIGCFV